MDFRKDALPRGAEILAFSPLAVFLALPSVAPRRLVSHLSCACTVSADRSSPHNDPGRLAKRARGTSPLACTLSASSSTGPVRLKRPRHRGDLSIPVATL